MSRLVLDLRTNARNTADGLRLTNAVASGTVAGYRVESQLRTRNQVRGLSMRLSAPDGRVLDVVGDPHRSPDNAKSPVTHALSAQVGYAFRARLSARAEQEAVDAIEATITAGLDCLRHNKSGRRARIIVQSAALGLDSATVGEFLEAHTDVLATSRRMSRTQRRAFASDLTVAQAGWLIEAGFAPEQVSDWFPHKHYVGRNHVLAMGHFRANGWTLDDITNLGQRLLANANAQAAPRHVTHLTTADIDQWCHFTVAQAMAATQAGLSTVQTRRLLRSNTFNADAFEMLGGLLINPFRNTMQLVG